MQITKTRTLRVRASYVPWFRPELVKQYQLPFALIGIAMLGYVVIVWRWL